MDPAISLKNIKNKILDQLPLNEEKNNIHQVKKLSNRTLIITKPDKKII